MNKQSTIPTHFRFLKQKEAKDWDRTTEDWVPISEIQIGNKGKYFSISAASFAWVIYDSKKPNLEFKTDKFNKKDLKEFANE